MATIGSRLLRLRQLTRQSLDHVPHAQHVLVGHQPGELAGVLLREVVVVRQVPGEAAYGTAGGSA